MVDRDRTLRSFHRDLNDKYAQSSLIISFAARAVPDELSIRPGAAASFAAILPAQAELVVGLHVT